MKYLKLFEDQEDKLKENLWSTCEESEFYDACDAEISYGRNEISEISKIHILKTRYIFGKQVEKNVLYFWRIYDEPINSVIKLNIEIVKGPDSYFYIHLQFIRLVRKNSIIQAFFFKCDDIDGIKAFFKDASSAYSGDYKMIPTDIGADLVRAREELNTNIFNTNWINLIYEK